MRMQPQELTAHIVEMGAYKAALLDVSLIHFDRKFRELCQSNACGNYGACWTCPPDAGDIDTLIARAKTYQKALVYQTVGQLEDSFDIEGMLEAGKLHNDLAQAISRWAREAGAFGKDWLHLGAGGCRLCPVCAKRTGEPCRHPQDAMASLETYGVAVSELAASCGMKYINGQNTVTYFGAVLFQDGE